MIEPLIEEENPAAQQEQNAEVSDHQDDQQFSVNSYDKMDLDEFSPAYLHFSTVEEVNNNGVSRKLF